MSMISELVKGLRKLGNQWKHNDVAGCNLIFDAADTIEVLSEKVRANNLYGGWIPCSEMLPKEDGRYLVCMDWDRELKNISVLDWAEGWNCYRVYGEVKRESEIPGTEIIAWMPLPEVYRGGETE